MAGQTSIKSLAEQNLRRLAVALDAVAPNGEEYWRLLVDQLPRGSYQTWEVEKKFAAATLQDGSPSLLLLENVQQRELVPTVEDLVIVLTRIECQRALNVLALKSKVNITQQPVDCMVLQGGVIRLYCEAECVPHGPLYQWFISQVGEGGKERTLPFRGATEKQLMLQRADITHHGRYCCRCTNPYMAEEEEGRVAFSKWAMVTVAGVPVILKEPDPIQSVPIGQDLTLSVYAECHPGPPEYRWFRVSEGKHNQLEGHREAVLKFRICTFDDAGEYFCIVGNPLLSEQQEGWRASTMTVVQVLPPDVGEHHEYGMAQVDGPGNEGGGSMIYGPELRQPESCTGSEAELNSPVRDVGQDQFGGNDAPWAGIARSPLGTPSGRHRPHVLQFSVDQQSMAGGQSMHNYQSGKVHQPQSTGTGGTLPTPAQEENNILFSCQPEDMTVLMKQSFTVHCRAETGSENLWYQLFERKVNGECSPVTDVSTKGDFDVNSGSLSGPNQEVVLFVRAFKESDSQSHSSVYQDSTHFKVQFKEAMFVAQPLQKVRATAEKDAMLMCRLASSDEHPPEVTYQWYRGEHRNSNDFKLIPDEKSNILRLSNLSPNDTGYYGCKVCVVGDRPDIYYSEETHLTVGNEEEGDIVITEQPLPKAVEVKRGGDYKFFTCAMSRIGEPLQFVWQKDGRQCRTEGPILEIKSATVADSGTYRCVVTAVNSGRKKETAAVNLTVPRPVDLTKVTPHMKAEAYVKGKLRGKVALLIANQDYSHYQKLQTAEEDVKKLARELRILGFNVLTLANLTSREMQEAQDVFCHHLLSKDATGVLAFVYFAGHGFLDPQDSAEYLMPVDAANLTPNSNINRESFCLSLRSTPQCAKLLRITDCCRTVGSSEDVQQRPVRPPSSLQRQEDFYNFLDVKGCGYFRTASEVFLAKILQELMAKRHLTLHELIQGIQEKARQCDQKTGHQRPQVTAHNMAGMEQMKLSDEIDRAAYAHLADPAPDQECVERWTKLDPSGLPKNLVLGNELREKVEVKLTIEEIFSNVLRVTVCAERQGTGANSLSVSIDVASLRESESEIEVRDEEGCKTETKHVVVLRSIQNLKHPLTLDVCINDEHGSQVERLTYTAPAAPLYSALKPS